MTTIVAVKYLCIYAIRCSNNMWICLFQCIDIFYVNLGKGKLFMFLIYHTVINMYMYMYIHIISCWRIIHLANVLNSQAYPPWSGRNEDDRRRHTLTFPSLTAKKHVFRHCKSGAGALERSIWRSCTFINSVFFHLMAGYDYAPNQHLLKPEVAMSVLSSRDKALGVVRLAMIGLVT